VLKPKEVIDLAEKLNYCDQYEKHPYDLAFEAAFCLYFLGSLSIMLRDLQDASALPQNLTF